MYPGPETLSLVTSRQLHIAIAIAVASVTGPTRGEPADTERREVPAPVALDLEALRAELISGDPERIRAALARIESAADAGRPAAPLVEELLRRGTSVTVLVHALGVAGQVGTANTSRVIAPYMRHRVEKVRWAAARALGSTGGPSAEVALKLGLRSPGAPLRESSAEALGRAGAKGALGDLLVALVRGVKAASKASGQVCDAHECLKLLAQLDQVGFEGVRDGLATLLSRPEEQAPIWVKLTVVDRIVQLRSPAARDFLSEARARAAGTSDEVLQQALDRALAQLASVSESATPERH